MATAIVFDSNNLQNAPGGLGIVTQSIDHYSIPSKNANQYALAHANKSVLPFINYPLKLITIKGYIKGSSISDTDTRVDNFKAYFNKTNGNLDIGHAGTTRRYIVLAVQAVDIPPDQGLTVREFTVIFICLPFGQNVSATVANNATGVTSGSPTYSHTYLGSAPIQLPIITITLNSLTTTDGHIKITNNANGQGILLVGQVWVPADVIVIDSTTRTVKRNGVEIDYLGSFIELTKGAQQLNWEDGFTARNFDINVSYYPLWL